MADYLGVDDWLFFAADDLDTDSRLMSQFLLELGDQSQLEARQLETNLAREWREIQDRKSAADDGDSFLREQVVDSTLPQTETSFRFINLKLFFMMIRWKRRWRVDFQHRAHVASEILALRPLRKPRFTLGSVRQFCRVFDQSPPSNRERFWLAQCVVDGSGPKKESLEQLETLYEIDGRTGLRNWMFEKLRAASIGPDFEYSAIEVSRGALIVDVSTTVETELLTGIQRVVRCLLTDLEERSFAEGVRWNPTTRSYKRVETRRVDDMSPEGTGVVREVNGATLIPLECTLILPEVVSNIERIQSLEQFLDAGFARQAVAIAYDLIPVEHPELVPVGSVGNFVRYLQMLRRFSMLLAISEDVRSRLESWFNIYYDHDRICPTIVAVPLSNEVPSFGSSQSGVESEIIRLEMARRSPKFVLISGTFEPRKNQLRALFACELLWREGVEFEVCLVGFGGWPDYPVQRIVELLVRKGRLVRIRSQVTDTELRALQLTSDVVLFVSLAEGFGLPVVEALGAGTTVVASRIPAIQELATDDVILVDPLDPRDIADGLNVALQRSRPEKPHGYEPSRSWKDYSDEVLLASGIVSREARRGSI